MFATIEKVMVLKRVDLFDALWGEELSDIAGVAEEVRFKCDDVIIQEGQVGDELFVVISGDVRVYTGDTELAVLGKNTVFGEVSILDRQPRTASVAALGDVSLLRLRQSDFDEVMRRTPQISLGIVKVLCRRLRNQNRKR